MIFLLGVLIYKYRKKYIVEVNDVDNEYDFKMTAKSTYLNKYGDDEYYEKW